MSKPEFGAVVICDDIRREINGKDLLLGVFTGNIILSQIPAALPFAIWIERIKDEGNSFHIKISYAGKQLAVLNVAKNKQADEFIGVALPGIQINVPAPGDLVIEYSKDEKDWFEIKRKKVLHGAVNVLVNVGAPPSQKAS